MKLKLLILTAVSFILVSCGNGEQKAEINDELSNDEALNYPEASLEELKQSQLS